MSRRVAPFFILVLMATMAAPSAAHEERESEFPDGTGAVPIYREFSEAVPHLVVCQPESTDFIDDMDPGARKDLLVHLLAECEFRHLQEAVDAVTAQGTNIYVLPGHYREQPSWDPPCVADYDGGVVEYELMFDCGEVVNLITIAGDDPDDADHVCDLAVCNLQIEGMGDVPQDVRFTGGFRDNGDWVKHNILKADRADGIYLKNMAFELARENAVYVHETDGYFLDQIEGNFNDLYGILTFASDHGVIKDCVTHHNGDSGIYPGSASDVNADSREAVTTRWAVEIFGCDSYNNALAFSGTAGNSVYFHDNWAHDNGAGYVTDSFIPNHPGMPVDHARVENNHIFRNNVNYYPNVQGEDAPCHRERPVDRGHQLGVVCPAFLPPVGSGIVFAGTNFQQVRNNWIYDNHRLGAMLLYVPPAIREEYGLGQFDVSHGNQFTDNHMGEHPSGVAQPNGVDFWWDDQGHGNCWQGNTSFSGTITRDLPGAPLPTCDAGGSGITMDAANAYFSTFGTDAATVPTASKSGLIVNCAFYNRNDNPEPDLCDWYVTPPVPGGRVDAGDDHMHELVLPTNIGVPEDVPPQPDRPLEDDEGSPLPATGPQIAVGLIGLMLLGAGLLRRRTPA